MKLRAHANVVSLEEERRLREQQRAAHLTEKAVRFNMGVLPGFVPLFIDPPPPRPRSHPAAQALLAGIMQGVGERENDPALLDAGRRLGEAAQKGHPAAPERRWRPKWLRAVLALARRPRTVLSRR